MQNDKSNFSVFRHKEWFVFEENFQIHGNDQAPPIFPSVWWSGAFWRPGPLFIGFSTVLGVLGGFYPFLGCFCPVLRGSKWVKLFAHLRPCFWSSFASPDVVQCLACLVLTPLIDVLLLEINWKENRDKNTKTTTTLFG